MSDLSPRRAPLVAILAIFVLFALFAAVAYYIYVPRRTGAYTGDGLRTAEERIKNLAELHAKEAEAASTYGWVDQKAGIVRLPLNQAQELTLQHYAKKQ